MNMRKVVDAWLRSECGSCEGGIVIHPDRVKAVIFLIGLLFVASNALSFMSSGQGQVNALASKLDIQCKRTDEHDRLLASMNETLHAVKENTDRLLDAQLRRIR
jgi:hypothetical protein